MITSFNADMIFCSEGSAWRSGSFLDSWGGNPDVFGELTRDIARRSGEEAGTTTWVAIRQGVNEDEGEGVLQGATNNNIIQSKEGEKRKDCQILKTKVLYSSIQ